MWNSNSRGNSLLLWSSGAILLEIRLGAVSSTRKVAFFGTFQFTCCPYIPVTEIDKSALSFDESGLKISVPVPSTKFCVVSAKIPSTYKAIFTELERGDVSRPEKDSSPQQSLDLQDHSIVHPK